uniref:Uncharacterized protein n=1 Tax=Percolomonas cosmopolitus TaxID=63605 RepID=A0A7S1KSM0_9EUKA|mmetsp:Transcript_5433/g.20292  ORF Transcript_5433/g.20292 Transcript_5433/m.20292 type:complete len:766 (+) Transcript_5433:195-2492(+)|eukprot:CAMPEP_0117438136 /NCGR_PEP_ID=MMETSP0759-20121206/1895_1 /TAXON_ID=63605 /ORGANISM="Percolomonas cosmopolitus, Strain WS" /LENGTH=765 /DNA_ID=CAMNT_0005229813 /DNA_START=142 /DNA_END=2439 /DNA_ORIENTATION=+
MSSRKQHIAHLKSKINQQISILKEHFRNQKQLRSEKLRSIEDVIEAQTDGTLKVMEMLMAECEQVDSLWASIMEWKMRQECTIVWDTLQRDKMERIRNSTRHIEVSLHDIMRKETENVLNTVPKSLHDHLQTTIDQFRNQNRNVYNDCAFSHDLHHVSEMTNQQELNLIEEEINRYFESSRMEQKRLRTRNRKQSRDALRSHVNCLIQQQRQESSQNRDETFEHYMQVSRDELKMLDAHMKDSIKLSLSEKQRKAIYFKTDEQAQQMAIQREFDNIIQMEPNTTYKTDIGIHDEQMQELQYEIEQWHEYIIIETGKYTAEITEQRRINDSMNREVDDMKQSMHSLRRQHEHATSEVLFLQELSQLSEEDLTREIKKKKEKLDLVRSQIQSTQHSALLIEVSQASLEKDAKKIKEGLQVSKEKDSSMDVAITETTEELTNQRHIAESLLSAEVWTMLGRLEMRDEQAKQRLQRQLSECCKSGAEAVMESLLATMFEASVMCLRAESDRLTQFSYDALRRLLAKVHRDSKIRERSFLSHLGFLRALYDPSAKIRKPDKILKKQQSLWEKKFAQWEKIQDDFIAAASASETLKNAFRIDLFSRSNIDSVSEHLWIKKEMEAWIPESDWDSVCKSNQELKSKVRHLSDYCNRLFTKFELFEWYLHREHSTRKVDFECGLESPYVVLTQRLVAKDDTIGDPMLLRITDSLHPCQVLKDRDAELSEKQNSLLEECKALRKSTTNISHVDSLALSDAIVLIKQKYNEKYRDP